MEMPVDRMLGIFGVLGIVIGVGVAIAMDPKIKSEMLFAIGCFIFSGITLCLTVGIWAFNTDLSAMKRLLIGSPLFVIICMSMVEASRWANGRYYHATERPADSPPHEAVESKPILNGAIDTVAVAPAGSKNCIVTIIGNIKNTGAQTPIDGWSISLQTPTRKMDGTILLPPKGEVILGVEGSKNSAVLNAADYWTVGRQTETIPHNGSNPGFLMIYFKGINQDEAWGKENLLLVSFRDINGKPWTIERAVRAGKDILLATPKELQGQE